MGTNMRECSQDYLSGRAVYKMDKFVICNIDRPNQYLIDAYLELDVSTVYEAQGKKGLLCPVIKPIQEGAYIVGPAITVSCRAGDNLMIHAAIEVCKPDDILVVTTVGESTAGMIGELIVMALQKRGVGGLIIEAGVRDVKRIKELGFPVWSKAVSSQGTTKIQGGTVNGKVVCGGTIIHAGDLVLADDDGIVVVEYGEVESSLAQSRARIQKEEMTKKRIANGELGLDFYGLRETLEKQDVHYYENMKEYMEVTNTNISKSQR